jgi:hypothetical protein
MSIDRTFGDSTVVSKPVLEFGNPSVDPWRRECRACPYDSANCNEMKKSTNAIQISWIRASVPPPRGALALMASKLLNDCLGHIAEVNSSLIQPANKVADGGQIHSQSLLG